MRQMALGRPNLAHTWPPDGPKMVPRWPKVTPKWHPRWILIYFLFTRIGFLEALGSTRPQYAPDGAREAQFGAHMAPRWPQNGPNVAKSDPKMARRRPTMDSKTIKKHTWKSILFLLHCISAPRWLYLGAKMAQDGPNMPQDGSEVAPRWLERLQDGPNMAQARLFGG